MRRARDGTATCDHMRQRSKATTAAEEGTGKEEISLNFHLGFLITEDFIKRHLS